MSIIDCLRKLFGKRAKKPKNTPTEPTEPTGQKFGLCIGINKFIHPVNNLRGAVNDSVACENLLKRMGFSVVRINDEHATRDRILSELSNLTNNAKQGDEVFIFISTHGSNIEDTNGDETDARDEVWITHEESFIIDDEIRTIVDSFDDGVKITVVSDSCHSGTMTRSFIESMDTPEYIKAKYLPPTDDTVAFLNARLMPKDFDVEIMREVLISGSSATEFSYDAAVNGTPRGILSFYLFNILEDDPTLTYKEAYEKIRTVLPSRSFHQTPQFEGKVDNLNKRIFD